MWNFGDGSTGAGVTATHVYTVSGNYTPTLTVNDGRGLTNTFTLPPVTAGVQAPTPVITSPTNGSTYTAGDTINFSGTATDPADGLLPASAFNWSIVFHHETHTHSFIPSIAGVTAGSFVIPTDGETDPVQWYRVTLTVTDSAKVSNSTYVDVFPKTSRLTLASNVPQAGLTLDGQSVAAPSTQTAVAGLARVIGAAPLLTVNETNYQFTSWSDGGAASHTIQTPAADTTYTATYTNSNTPLPYLGAGGGARGHPVSQLRHGR